MGYGSSDAEEVITMAEQDDDDDDDDAASCIAVAIPATLAALKEEKEHAAQLRAGQDEGEKRKAVEQWLGVEECERDVDTERQSVICSSEAPTVRLARREGARSSSGEDVMMRDLRLATPKRKKVVYLGTKGGGAMLTPPFSG